MGQSEILVDGWRSSRRIKEAWEKESWNRNWDLGQINSCSEFHWRLCSALRRAAKIHGPQSCQRMQNTLKESIEKKAEGGMFETAKEKMKMQLQELKNYVVTKLQKDVSIMLKLALSHQEGLTERLPDQDLRTSVTQPEIWSLLQDFQDEYREIDQIHKMLQGM
ncbi:unnamed protein product [Eretmochelys imbricata]